MAKSNTSRYGRIISESSRLPSVSPAIYQLNPKKETFDSLTRLTIGVKNLKKKNTNILFVGETGTGKSTLINALVNYAMGVKFEDNIWFEIVERETRSQTESQTSDVVVYEVFGFEDQTLPFSLTIIDTPGFGDTRGTELDVIVSQRLFDLFRSKGGVHEIDAVGLVMKASENRVSDRLRYIFDSVMSLFGRDLEEKIVILITYSDGLTPENALNALETANIKCAKTEKKQPVHFMFNNSQSTQRTAETEFGLKTSWRVTQRGMAQFTKFLQESRAQTLEKTSEVLNSHISIVSCVHNLQERIMLIELKQKEINQVAECLNKYKQEMNQNENFTVEVEEVYKDKEPISGGMWAGVFFKGAVTCPVCEENCHYPGCTMSHTPKGCEVMRKGHCTVCTKRCPVSAHVKETWKYVIKTKTVQRTRSDMKAKYEKNKSEHEKKLSLLENLKNEVKFLETEKNQLLEESYKHVVRLELIALNVNSVTTYVHLDVLIKRMEEKGDGEKVQKLMEMKSRVDKGTGEAVQYMFRNLGNRFKEFCKK